MTNILALNGRKKRITELETELQQMYHVKRKFWRAKEINRYYKAKIESLESIIRLRDAQIDVLKDDIDRLKIILAQPVHARSVEPLWLSEADEDDIETARLEAEDMLRQLEFENSDIEIESV